MITNEQLLSIMGEKKLMVDRCRECNFPHGFHYTNGKMILDEGCHCDVYFPGKKEVPIFDVLNYVKAWHLTPEDIKEKLIDVENPNSAFYSLIGVSAQELKERILNLVKDGKTIKQINLPPMTFSGYKVGFGDELFEVADDHK